MRSRMSENTTDKGVEIDFHTFYLQVILNYIMKKIVLKWGCIYPPGINRKEKDKDEKIN